MIALIGLAGLAGGTPRPPPPPPTLAGAPTLVGPVDVNAATAEELASLPRIGPTLAARIVEDRRARGPFRTVDDLDRVPGLGPATIALIRPHAVAISTE